MIKHPNKEIKDIFKEFGVTRERFLQALSTVRGNQRVTSDNPEATYDTLNKYGTGSGGKGAGSEAGSGHRP